MTAEIEEIRVEDYFDLVYKLAKNYAYACGQHREIRESDAFAEGVLCLLKAKKAFDPSRNSKFLSYAYRCVQCGLVNWWRKYKRHFREYSAEQDFSEIMGRSEHRPYRLEEIEELWSLVSLFPAGSIERTIFEMRMDGATFQAIGDAVGKTKQNVEQNYWQAKVLKALRNYYTEKEKR